jgi:hypothetical protein
MLTVALVVVPVMSKGGVKATEGPQLEESTTSLARFVPDNQQLIAVAFCLCDVSPFVPNGAQLKAV